MERTSAAVAQLGYISYDSVALIYLQRVIIRDCLVVRDIQLIARANITFLGRFFDNGRCV